jgi:cytochrome c2
LAEAETAAGGDAKEAEDAPKQAAVVPDQFNRCAACHSATPGRNGVAPSLAGIVGRKAGTEAGYKYSAAMKNSGVTWTVANLDRHIEDASLVVPGNKMVTLFPKGVADKRDRDAIIAYLETL